MAAFTTLRLHCSCASEILNSSWSELKVIGLEESSYKKGEDKSVNMHRSIDDSIDDYLYKEVVTYK